jgi:hypothetical protein
MAIQCHEFERMWNELLDAGAVAPTDRERVLLEHGTACDTCRHVAKHYELLRRALREWGPPPEPSPGLADRILAEIQSTNPPACASDRSVWRRLPRKRVLLSVAAAGVAACLVLFFAIDRWRPNWPPAGANVSAVGPGQPASLGSKAGLPAPPPLNAALADATDATWDLARSASEPAARISRQVIDVAAGLEPGAAQPAADGVSDPRAVPVSAARLGSLALDSATATAVLEHFSAGLATGVQPLSSTARHAFGFLLGPAASQPDVRTKGPAEKGA